MSCCACAGTCNHIGNHWFCTAHGGGGAYITPALPTPPAVVVTQRQVPVVCEVCKGGGVRKQDPNDDESWSTCDACHGKGWLMVTETTTTRTA